MAELGDDGRWIDLQGRLEALEAERDIGTVLSLYSNHADARRDDEWVALWAPDGELEIALGPASPVYQDPQRWRGHDGLRRFITNPDAHHKVGFYGRSLHLHGNNTIVQVDRDHAVATTYSLLLHQDDGTLRIMGAGVCAWSFVRLGGRWLIASCVRRRVGSTETAALLQLPQPPAQATVPSAGSELD